MPNRKFAGIRAELERAKQTPTPTTHPGKARTPGKRSNPAWTQHTVMLEKATHRAALGILLHQDNGTDVSDLLNQLLAQWVEQNQIKQ
jgi:hypothetical protein